MRNDEYGKLNGSLKQSHQPGFPAKEMDMRILIVEDNKKHMEDAVLAVEGLGHEAVCATTVGYADHILEEEKIDAVVTDVYLPLDDSREKWNHSKCPCGINVSVSARMRGIPCVFCTDGNHHDGQLEWLNGLILIGEVFPEAGIILPPMIDGKNWEWAIKVVTEMKQGGND